MQKLNNDGISGILDTTEEQISELEDRSAITTQNKVQRLNNNNTIIKHRIYNVKV